MKSCSKPDKRRRGQRLVTGAVIGLVLMGCKTALRDDLSESEADDVIALLRQEGIDSSKERGDSGKWSIIIKEEAIADAQRVAHLYGAPRSPHASIAEVFPGTGLLPSELEERARYEFALGHELARTIEQIDGVLAARVHVVIPVQNPRLRERANPQASVFVRYRSDQRIDLMKSRIKALVINALPGAKAEAVSVMTVAVFPPAVGPRSARAWLGVRYRGEDGPRLALLVLMPWLLLMTLLGYLGWRGGMHHAAHGWLSKCRKRFFSRPGKARPAHRA